VSAAVGFSLIAGPENFYGAVKIPAVFNQMSKHLSDEQIRLYRRKEMNARELLEADAHLEFCDECLLKTAGRPAFAGFDLADATAEESVHLAYRDLEKYVDGNSDRIELEIADAHLQICENCREEARDLASLRDLIKTDLAAAGTSAKAGAAETILERLKNFFAGSHGPRFGFAALAVLLLLSASGIFWLARRDSPAEIAGNNAPQNENGTDLPRAASPEPAARPSSVTNPSPSPAIAPENKNTAPADRDGDLSNQTPAFSPEVRQALLTERLNLPAELAQLKNQSGKLMGGDPEQVPFALAAPVGIIIQSDRPRFAWRALAGATSYSVNVYDTNYGPVAASPPLAETVWQIDRPLARGKTYLWQVTAVKDGQEIKSPVRPAPDARFKILEAQKLSEIAEAKRRFPDSPLVIGILYARAGLLAEAEREFQKEINKNPQSKAARNFLRQVRAQR
jgi:hypothetical protein